MNNKSRLAVGIVVDEDSFPLLNETILQAETLSDRVFVLSVGNTPEIDETTAIVLRGGFPNDEAATRNELIQFVENSGVADWLVWMNPGDKFDKATLTEFELFTENELNRDSIYMMVLHRLYRNDGVRHDFDEENIDARLMPLNKGVRYQGRVKASLLSRNATLMMKISAAPGRFIVPSKQNDPARTKKRAERNLQLLDKIENEGNVVADDLLTFRSESLLTLKNYAAARRTLLQLIVSTTRSDLRLAAYYDLWETIAHAPIPDAEVTNILTQAIDRYPVDMQLLTFLGSHMQRIGKHDLAIRSFETAVKHGRISLDVWHRLRIREIAVTSLALTLRLQNKNREAIRVLETNIDLIDDRTEFSRHLIDLYIAENLELKASELAATIWGDHDLDLIRMVLTGACQAKAGNWKEAVHPLETAYFKGCRDILCLRWYSLTLLSLGQFPQAVAVLEQWLALEPDNSEAKSYHTAAQRPERFGEMLRQIRDRQLRSLGVKPNHFAPKSHIRIDEAVREMIHASGSFGGIQTVKVGNREVRVEN
jgi:tetratricopeptide (TPR) repeat protein